MHINKKNQKKVDYIVKVIEKAGFVKDRYGNYRKDDFRYKLNATSYRFEQRLDTTPPEWFKLDGKYYKDVMVK